MALKNNREPNDESINLNKETEGSSSNRSENSSDNIVKLDISRTPPAIDSPLSSAAHISTISRPLFPPSMRPSSSTTGAAVAQLFHNSSSSSRPDQTVKEESSFCNMFCGMDDQNGFWPWLEQQQYNWFSFNKFYEAKFEGKKKTHLNCWVLVCKESSIYQVQYLRLVFLQFFYGGIKGSGLSLTLYIYI